MNAHDISRFIRNAARSHPGKVALRCEDASITYAQLDALIEVYRARILQLAQGHARAVAAVIAYKSIDAIAFCQAALRCGWAYTVIDPRYPAKRIAAMLNDCAPRVILTDPGKDVLRTIGSSAAIIDIRIGTHSAVPQRASVEARPLTVAHDGRESAAEADSVAFILYTSGSTGIPKGVRISHRNADYSITWAQQEFEFRSDEIFLNQAHLGVDFCVLDLFNAWNVAATVALVPEYSAIFPGHVVEVIRKEGVTNLWLVPSNVVALMDHGLLETDASRLRRFLYGGEPFPASHLRRLRGWTGEAPIYNLYGPAEANFVTARRLTAADLASDEVPIGRPIAGTSLKVRSDTGVLSDTGRGEICVASPSVFAGYTQPALNESKFLYEGATTWYRTGDWGVIDPDGTVWYRGRVDHMVKVRGYRIELPEIELTLLRHPAIAQAAVVAIDRAGEGKEIHAVCVCAQPVSSQEIRTFLSDALPGFMVPRSVSFVDRLAVNDRGKVDRQALAQALQA